MINAGKWVRCAEEEAPRIRKSFTVPDIKTAEIAICGLGMFELYINGTKVSEDVLVPAWSEYEKRKTEEMYEVSHRIYYMCYDVTQLLKNGENTMGILLGNGWYNQYAHKIAGDTEYGLPKLCFVLNITHFDGSVEKIISDETLKFDKSYIYYNNMYLGEKQDLRLFSSKWSKNGFDDSEWKNVSVIETPDSMFVKQTCPPDRRICTKPVKKISENGNVCIYDVGENMAGWMKVAVRGKKGEKISVRYAEELYSDGTMNFSTAGWPNQIQAEEYISSGEEMICEPHFTFHGFRYCEITGDAKAVEAVVVHSDVSPKATFRCDNDVINWFFDAYMRTQLCNMHMGVPSDCPQRERLGYTGDGQICCDAGMLLFNSREFYRKWIYDIYDCQDINTGHVHHTAPGYGDSGGGPGGWGCAIVVVPYYFFRHFGETEILKEGYPKMCKWIEYMKSRSENGLVVREEEKGWCLGEWCTPDAVLIPPPYINTYYLIKALLYMKEIASAIGENFIYDELIKTSKDAILREYYDVKAECFAGGIQGADVFGVDLGLGSEKILQRVANFYGKERSFDTGIFGTHILMKLLFENGFEDEAAFLLSSDKANSYGYMKNHNATTLWERWNGGEYHKNGNSHNHPMFGACSVYLFYSLLGLRVLDEKITIKPHIPSMLNYVEGSIETIRGKFSVKYERSGEKFDSVIIVESSQEVEFIYKETHILLKNGENRISF